jgi:hypothetical protein
MCMLKFLCHTPCRTFTHSSKETHEKTFTNNRLRLVVHHRPSARRRRQSHATKQNVYATHGETQGCATRKNETLQRRGQRHERRRAQIENERLFERLKTLLSDGLGPTKKAPQAPFFVCVNHLRGQRFGASKRSKSFTATPWRCAKSCTWSSPIRPTLK